MIVRACVGWSTHFETASTSGREPHRCPSMHPDSHLFASSLIRKFIGYGLGGLGNGPCGIACTVTGPSACSWTQCWTLLLLFRVLTADTASHLVKLSRHLQITGLSRRRPMEIMRPCRVAGSGMLWWVFPPRPKRAQAPRLAHTAGRRLGAVSVCLTGSPHSEHL